MAIPVTQPHQSNCRRLSKTSRSDEEQAATSTSWTESPKQHNGEAAMQAGRFMSVDFMRGISVFCMLSVHVIHDVFDVETAANNLLTGPLINLVALGVLPIFGGLAGFFLMSSAMSNMVQMRKAIQEKGRSPTSVAQTQVGVGMLLVLFAMVLEASVGNQGSLGMLIRSFGTLDGHNNDWTQVWKFQGYHFESVHAIGWATAINGMTQAFISKRWNIQTQGPQIIRVYWFLAVLVLALTPIVWATVSYVIPGYPWEINPITGNPLYLPTIGKSPWQDFLLYFFINPLAAPVEPLFPYMATSYIGSLVALHMTEPSKTFDQGFVRRLFAIGFVMSFVGLVGLYFVLKQLGDLVSIALMYVQLYDHRKWTAANGVPGGWFWQYLTLNGASMMSAALFIRCGECRGKDNQDIRASATLFLRRMGCSPFSVYMLQWFYVPICGFVCALGGTSPHTMSWPGTLLTLTLMMVFMHVALLKWSKIGYIGSVEWGLVTCAHLLMGKQTVKTKQTKDHGHETNKTRWWQLGQLDAQRLIGDKAQFGWFPCSLEDEERLIRQLSWGGFILFPIHIVTLRCIWQVKKKHPNSKLENCYWRALTGIFLTTTGFILLCCFSWQDLFGVGGAESVA